MGAIIEVSYFNTFLLKKTVNSNTSIPNWNGSFGVPTGVAGATPVITSISNDDSWAIEESRIRGGYNNTNVDYGVKAYLVEDNPNASFRINALIYSGIYNSRTGINDTNVFSVGEDITKAVDPVNGSIQKLYAEDTNLIIFQESKVSRALIDKDAIYSAEGGGSITNSNLVIGTIQPYAGEFGISTNPESFASYGYQKYFTDKNNNSVLRLSMDGMTEISKNGMTDFFRDEFGRLETVYGEGKAVGGYDVYTKQYVLSLQQSKVSVVQPPNTPVPNPNPLSFNISFDETVLGFPSFFSYIPDQILSVQSNYYTFKDGLLYQHYDSAQSAPRNNFYEEQYDSSVTFVFNPKPSMSKVFKTINYEGSTGWQVPAFNANRSFELRDTILPVLSYADGSYVGDFGYTYYAGFDRKEGKYMANLVNDSSASPGEIIFGDSMTGVKGYIASVTIKSDTTSRTEPMELFAVSSEYIESAY